MPYRNSAANLAQLVEQVIRNDQVGGSNPLVGSTPLSRAEVFLFSEFRLETIWTACPLRLSARTSGSHPGKRGSTPLEGAISAIAP